jgi:hypothetical protein
MTGLAALQRRFQAGLIAGDLSGLAGLVRAPAGLAVHAHAARAMLVDALADNHPKTLHWLGGESFTALALDYVALTPSSSWTLADYGADFAEYLARTCAGDPEVAELAALDWALRCAFAAADPPPGDWARAPGLNWDGLRLALAPGAALCRLTTNADEIWAAIPDHPVAPRLLAGTVTVLVWRDALEPVFRRLADSEAGLLRRLSTGAAFGAACDACGADADRIGQWLAAWLRAGLVVPRV